MKKLFIVLIMLLFSSFAYAQSIGLTIGEANSFTSIVDQELDAVINPQLLEVGAEVKLMKMLGFDFDLYYDPILQEIFMYDLSLKLYVPVFFLQPYVSIGSAWMQEPGTKLLEFEGQNYTYEFDYSYSIKLGVDVFVLKRVSIGVELAYYGNNLKDMFNNITSENSLDIGLNSYVFIGAKIWL